MFGIPKYVGLDKSEIKAYRAYKAIKNRIENPHYYAFHRYGGRGITMKWNHYLHFLKDVGLPPTLNHTIDRIDNNGHYTKENTRWATWTQQARNRINNRLIDVDGITKTTAEWCEEYNVSPTVVSARITKYGWNESLAITHPVKKVSKKRMIRHNNQEHSIKEWSEIKGINLYTLRNRLERGWSIERALS